MNLKSFSAVSNTSQLDTIERKQFLISQKDKEKTKELDTVLTKLWVFNLIPRTLV